MRRYQLIKDLKNISTKLLKQLYNEYQLKQLIKDYTRFAVIDAH